MTLSTATDAQQYLFVSLDDTLVRTNVSLEAALQLLKNRPSSLFQMLGWLLKGRAYANNRISRLVDLDIDALPFEERLLVQLRESKAIGTKIVLVTSAPRPYAEKVAQHLGLFDEVLASDANRVLQGSGKLDAIRQLVAGGPFAFAGSENADGAIRQAASENLFVNARPTDVELARVRGVAGPLITLRPPLQRAFVRGMRPYQYAKNALVFVPLFTSHEYFQISALVSVVVAFVCFSLCASGVYFLNDLLDLPADRRHPTKRERPLASGGLPLPFGLAGAIVLPLLAFTVAVLFLPPLFTAVLAFYYALTNAYSFTLKQRSTVDVMALSILYTLRIVAGSAAAGIVLSSWLMAFSVFLFVSLAYLKRYIEISRLPETSPTAHGRGYSSADQEPMFVLGIANGTAAVLVLALYINSDMVMGHYRSPGVLWLLCFLMLFWSNRIWIGAWRGKIDDDPVVFALRDHVSRLVGLACVATVLVSKYVSF